MPAEIVPRILRLPGYGVCPWEADEAANTLALSTRQTGDAPAYVCGGCGWTAPDNRDAEVDVEVEAAP